MNKCLVAILLVFGLTACTKKDERYYQMNPKALQRAIKACPDRQPRYITCQELSTIAHHMNTLAYQLQQSPQGFGARILALQEKIARLKLRLQTQEVNESAYAELKENEETLAEYLAVVKWLESPVS